MDIVCNTMVTHIEKLLFNEALGAAEYVQRVANEGKKGRNSFTKSQQIGELIVRFISEKNSEASALFSLIVEQIFLLPMSIEQLNSKALWAWLHVVVEPVLEAISKAKFMNSGVNHICGEVISILEFIFMTFVRLTLFELLFDDQIKVKTYFMASPSTKPPSTTTSKFVTVYFFLIRFSPRTLCILLYLDNDKISLSVVFLL